MKRGLGGVYRRGGTWWVRYSYRGKKYRESSDSAHRNTAVALLKKRLGEMGLGRLVGPDAEKVTVEDLRKMVLDDYALQGNKTARRAEQGFVHVIGHFGEAARAVDITTDQLTSYAQARIEEGAKRATAKMELALLRSGFNLAVVAGRLHSHPAWPKIEVRNTRKGFLSEEQFRAVASRLGADLRPVAEFLFLTGFRTSEALDLQWRNVDMAAGSLRIEASKNGEQRDLPFRALPGIGRGPRTTTGESQRPRSHRTQRVLQEHHRQADQGPPSPVAEGVQGGPRTRRHRPRL